MLKLVKNQIYFVECKIQEPIQYNYNGSVVCYRESILKGEAQFIRKENDKYYFYFFISGKDIFVEESNIISCVLRVNKVKYNMDKLKTISFPKDELGDTFRSHGLKPKTWYNIVSRKIIYDDIYFKVEGIDCYIPNILVSKIRYASEVNNVTILSKIIKWIKNKL